MLVVEKTPIPQSQPVQNESTNLWAGAEIGIGQGLGIGFDFGAVEMTRMVPEGHLLQKGVSEDGDNVVRFFRDGFHALSLSSAA